jgi:hypothetical protein
VSRKKQDAGVLQLTKSAAKVQLSDLLHEIEMLLELFPDLRDSYDPDELPVSFLLRKGARRAAKPAARRKRRT